MSLEDIFDKVEESQVESKDESHETEGETTSPQAETETQAEVEAENPEQKVEVARDETKAESEAEKKEDKPEESKESWTFAAVKEERRKRQELERKLNELQQEKKDIPDVLEDQDAFVKSIRDEYKQELAQTKVEIAREIMMDTHDDYEELETFFIEVVAPDNPVLAEEARKASNPAKFVYQNAKKYQEYKEFQGVDSMKEKLRAEIRAELEAELKKTQENKDAKVSNIKPSFGNSACIV